MPFSIRSLTFSYGSTSGTSCAPARSHAGRGPAKLSSMTHWVNGSATTAARSRTPSRAATSARSASVVAGAIRSTMVAGKATRAPIQSGRAPDRAPSGCLAPPAAHACA